MTLGNYNFPMLILASDTSSYHDDLFSYPAVLKDGELINICELKNDFRIENIENYSLRNYTVEFNLYIKKQDSDLIPFLINSSLGELDNDVPIFEIIFEANTPRGLYK